MGRGGTQLVLAMVHRDGHVGILSTSEVTDSMVRAQHDLIRRAGIQGWRLKHLGLEDALHAHLSGQNCPACHLVLPCGCSIGRALHRQCPHGSAERIHRLAHEAGYCTNNHPGHQGPPL